MVESVSPTYYAAGIYNAEFSLSGRGFASIPSDAIAILSPRNSDPLYYRFVMDSDVSCILEMKTGTEMRFVQTTEHSHNYPLYLGAILSPDRSVVYWENTSHPLP